mmetsp:Transcript_31042/g.68901  ORF Transcript_31042/g.68901 Transcript_31042/m.68901 type:complete len:241 (-) Transcript_31042:949-1671(-)
MMPANTAYSILTASLGDTQLWNMRLSRSARMRVTSLFCTVRMHLGLLTPSSSGSDLHPMSTEAVKRSPKQPSRRPARLASLLRAAPEGAAAEEPSSSATRPSSSFRVRDNFFAMSCPITGLSSTGMDRLEGEVTQDEVLAAPGPLALPGCPGLPAPAAPSAWACACSSWLSCWLRDDTPPCSPPSSALVTVSDSDIMISCSMVVTELRYCWRSGSLTSTTKQLSASRATSSGTRSFSGPS